MIGEEHVRVENFEQGDLVMVNNQGYGRILERMSVDCTTDGPMYKVNVFGEENSIMDVASGQPCMVIAGKNMTIKVKKNEWLTA